MDDRVERFSRLVTEGIEAWVGAGEILNEMLAEDPLVKFKIVEKIPWMTTDILDGFERMGRREIFPQLLLDQSEGARRLIRLPYAEQERLYGGEIPLAVMKRGEIITERRPIRDLNFKECQRAFSDFSLRPIAEQRKMLIPAPKRVVISATVRRTDSENEAIIQESLEDDPGEKIEDRLSMAQAALIRARELMVEKKIPHSLDAYITTALNAIGNLRYEIGELK